MTKQTTTKPKRAFKPKAAPAIILKSAEGIEAETITGEAARHPGGRPTDYLPQYATVARKMCAMGATDADLAEAFGVDTSTVWRWRTQHEEFCNALIVNKGEYDDRVERSLAQRAVGYSYDAVKIFMPSGADKPVYAPYREHVPPDPGACKLWLTNRRRAEWADTSKHELTAANGERLFPEPANSRAIARAILDVLREAKMEEQPDESTVEVALSEAEEIAAPALRVRSVGLN